MGAKRVKRSLATRRRLAQRWLDSGVTVREFAEAHRVPQSSLSRWVAELRESRRVREAPAGFLEVSTVAPAAVAVRLIVGAVTLELDRLPPAEYVAALRRAAC